jgi:RNA polymerase sigma factor (sigma-70 family)
MHPYSQKQITDYLVSIGAQHQDAEDAAQDTLVCLWEKPREVVCWTYVATIAKNKWIDSMRRQSRVQLTPSLEFVPAREEVPPADHSLLHASISKLTPPLKRAINDRFWLKRSHKESAAAHGIAEQTQKNNVARAKAKLHQLMT